MQSFNNTDNTKVPDITVIVPVYKVKAEYLRECAESIFNQTLRTFELIFVSDGAPQENIDILKEYEAKDDRVKLICQENKGVCVARNEAMKIMSGRYVTFIDSDDTVENTNLEDVVRFADENKSDVVMWGMYRCFEDHKVPFTPYLQDIPVFSAEQKKEVQFKCLVGILPFFVTPPASQDAAGSACAKLYRSDFLRENALCYTPGLKRAEDMLFNLRVFDAAERIGYLYRFYYNYRQVSTSATYTYRENGIDVFTASLNGIHEHLIRKNKSELYFQIYYMRCMFFFLESMDMDYLNPGNPHPLRARLNSMKEIAHKEPYKEAFANLKKDHLTWARRIPLFLIRHDMMALLAIFYSAFRLTRKGK